ncbi:hypothetical protein [Streptomyces sp. HUAS TT7]|uniref:hypothetical protein n=1 Tax=Streptomyces sp. HUAS TT7 TaxID=3447507 RepID=UPI003F65BB14
MGRVMQIKGLLGSGLPTRGIRQILPCLDKPRSIYFDDLTPEMLRVVECEHGHLTQRIDCLTRNRDAIGDYLETVRGMRAAADPSGRAGGGSWAPFTFAGTASAASSPSARGDGVADCLHSLTGQVA